ncbi:MAG: triphosphoribosyl-dephospho-CoA synthase [Halobacteriales archaeon]
MTGTSPRPEEGPVADAELALLLEVAATPTPGNVDRRRDLEDIRFEHMLAGAVGARPGLEAAANGASVGDAFERAVAGMARRAARNTQFGALLLLVPLVRAAGESRLDPAGVEAVVEATTVEDAVGFYAAFDHVAVGVGERPDEVEAPDVAAGADAEPALRAGDWTLSAVMADSAGVDDVAREWTTGFERTFAVAERIASGEGTVLDRAAEAFLEQLATHPDGHVAKRHDEATAERVRERAAMVREESGGPETFAADLVAAGINPGSTADVLAAGLFVALERGVSV